MVGAAYQDDPEKALAMLQKIKPPTAVSLRWQGTIYYIRKEWEKAEALFRRAIDMDPTNVILWNDLGWLYMDMEKFEEAISTFHQGADADPDSPYPFTSLGYTYIRQDEYEKAASSFQRAIELDPAFPYPYRGLGDVRLCQENYDAASEQYKAVMTFDPDDVYTWLCHYITTRRAGREKEAAHDLQTFVKTSRATEWPGVVARCFTGQMSEEEILTKTQRQDGEPNTEQECEASYYLGMKHLLIDDVGRAKEYFQRCLNTGARGLDEYYLARREMRRLEQDEGG